MNSLSRCSLPASRSAPHRTPEWKCVLAPVIVTVIRAPTVAAILPQDRRFVEQTLHLERSHLPPCGGKVIMSALSKEEMSS
jgi:hypothetical protein